VAFLAGYATEAGASRNISTIELPIAPKDLCEAHIVRNDVYRANSSDLDIGRAFIAGVAIRRLDVMTDTQYQSAMAACSH
jgi:hypothetical protein